MKVIVAAILVFMNSMAVAESPVADGPECIRAREAYARREALKREMLNKQKEPRPVKQSDLLRKGK